MKSSSVTKFVDTQWWYNWLVVYEYRVLDTRRGENEIIWGWDLPSYGSLTEGTYFLAISSSLPHADAAYRRHH